jgi:hypothetical protein
MNFLGYVGRWAHSVSSQVGNELEIFSRDTILFPRANVQCVYIIEPISEPAQFIAED